MSAPKDTGTVFWELEEEHEPLSVQLVQFPVAFAYFIISYVYDLFITFVFNWSTNLFERPLRSVFSYVLWTVSSVLLITLSVLVIIGDFLGVGEVIRHISEKFYDGNSVVNWGVPNLINGKEEDLQALKKIVDGEHKYSSFGEFDVGIAKAALLLSASVYEDFGHWKEFVLRISNHEVKVSQARQVDITITGSYVRILFIHFPETPGKVVISVIFKGTDPHNVNEWLTNLSMKKVEANEYLWGACHEGFYSKLFFLNRHESTAYDKLLRVIREMVERETELQSEDLEFRLFATGHSLGGGLSSVFYSRLLKAPKDLETIHSNIQFQGAYTFGAPRIGNFDFSREVSGAVKNPVNRGVVCWRVVNALDFAADVPFGMNDRHTAFITSSSDSQDILDYSHIGSIVQLRNSGKIEVDVGVFQVDTILGLIQWIRERTGAGETWDNFHDLVLNYLHLFDHWDLNNIFGGLLPFLGDHAPTRYYNNLTKGKDNIYRI